MVLLDSDRFLSELTRLFESTKDKGSLSITQKRTTEKDKKMVDEDVPKHRCLVRARTEKKKISTIVRFH